MKCFDIFIAIVISGLGMACSDFLEERSQDEVIPTTATDFREILLHYERYPFTPAIYAMDDDVEVDESQYWGDGDFFMAISHLGSFTWQPDMWENIEYTSSFYDNVYTDIMGMNAVLAKIEDAEGEMEEKEMVKAQALGTRGYYYFMHVNTYGEPYNYNKGALGVVLKLAVEYEEGGIARSTVAEVYDQVVKDLEMASALLNKYPKSRGDFLINSTAVDIILSRVYLYMEEWDNAIEAANRAIASAEGLFDYTTLPVGPRFYMTTYDNPEVEWLFSSNNFGTTLFVPSTELMSMFDEEDRRAEFIPGDYRGIGKTQTNGSAPALMIRSAEAYLNRAEARVLSETPDLPGALEDLNELRRHRITGYTDVNIPDAGTLLEEIREERRKELCFEGHRWFDLRRYGMPSISHDFRTDLAAPLLRYTLQEKDPLYTLPIPNSALENNLKLEQNASAFAPERVGVPIN